MSVLGISPSNLFSSSIAQSTQNKFQEIRSELQQLGQDLQSGNLGQAQQDYAALAQQLPGGQSSSNTVAGTNSPTSTLAQEFLTLGKDLQSGNLSAAQQDFVAIQKSAQQNAARGHGHHHRHRGGETSETNGTLQQDFGALGQALQSSNLSTAQQAYATLQSDLQQAFPGPTRSSISSASSPSASSTTVNVTA